MTHMKSKDLSFYEAHSLRVVWWWSG
jgi:hypothetical protein